MTVTESPSHLAEAIQRIAHKDNTQHMGDLIGRPYTESPLFWVRDIWQRFDWKNFNRNGYTTLRAFVVKILGASPIIPVKETNLNMQTLKQQAGAYAAQFVESGMVIGLGTGSTAIFATRRIAQRISKRRAARYHRHPHLAGHRNRCPKTRHSAQHTRASSAHQLDHRRRR